jgi:fatty-acyl-CoA synthase
VAALVVGGAQPIEVGELTAAVRQSLAGYKVPRRVRIVNEIPRMPNGKVDYPAAKDLVLQ